MRDPLDATPLAAGAPPVDPALADSVIWRRVLAAARGDAVAARALAADAAPLARIFAPLAAIAAVRTPCLVGQLGQSIDGRIATPTGDSKYINGEDGLRHLHRLRAFADAVVVGVATAIADDPLLNVRFVEGDNPARVVIDPRGRLPASARLLRDDGARRVLVLGPDARPPADSGIEVRRLPLRDGRFALDDLIALYADLGFARVLVEGGASTVSALIAAGRLDRLHVIVAPVILGSGYPGLTLPPIDRVADALRPAVRAHALGAEMLWDCAFSR